MTFNRLETYPYRPIGLFLIEKLNFNVQLILRVALILSFTFVIAALAQFAFYLPFTPVPVTGQTLGVLLAAATLGSRRGAICLGIYLLEGLCGLPFFAGGRSGPTVLFGPTGGYLIGFVVAAYGVGYLCEKGFDRNWKTSLPVFLVGHFLIFSIGLFWLSFFVGWKNALTAGLWPFIPGEILKTIFAAIMLPSAWRFLRPL